MVWAVNFRDVSGQVIIDTRLSAPVPTVNGRPRLYTRVPDNSRVKSYSVESKPLQFQRRPLTVPASYNQSYVPWMVEEASASSCHD